jgi:hypothetical protein
MAFEREPTVTEDPMTFLTDLKRDVLSGRESWRVYMTASSLSLVVTMIVTFGH